MKLFMSVSLLILIATLGCTKTETSAPKAEASASSNEPATDKGIGPVSSVLLEADIKESLAQQGHTLFQTKCSACHKVEERYVGPALKGVTQRRQPEWIMNMILNPQEMIDKNPVARELLGEYMVPMTFQNLTQDEARAILEYFRKNDAK